MSIELPRSDGTDRNCYGTIDVDDENCADGEIECEDCGNSYSSEISECPYCAEWKVPEGAECEYCDNVAVGYIQDHLVCQDHLDD